MNIRIDHVDSEESEALEQVIDGRSGRRWGFRLTGAHRRKPMNGYQIWVYEWSNGYGPIPTRAMSSTIYPTRAAAESAWYDTIPGRNDHACYVRIVNGVARHKNLS